MNTKKTILILFLIFIVACNEKKDDNNPGGIQGGSGDQYCIELYDPVCGEDGQTYSNECFAKTSNVNVKHKGEC